MYDGLKAVRPVREDAGVNAGGIAQQSGHGLLELAQSEDVLLECDAHEDASASLSGARSWTGFMNVRVSLSTPCNKCGICCDLNCDIETRPTMTLTKHC